MDTDQLPKMTEHQRETWDLLCTSGATRESPMTFHGSRFRAAMWLFEQGLVELAGCAFYIPEAEQDDQDDLRLARIETARAYLDATAYASETVFAFRLDENRVCLVSDDAIADLGRRQEDADLDEVLAGHFDSWLAGTKRRTVEAHDIAMNIRALGREVDLDTLEAEAGSAGDYETAAAIALMGDAVEKCLRSIEERAVG